MNRSGINYGEQPNIKRIKRFNRSQSKDSLSIGKRALSSCSSQENFHNFYMKTSKIPRNQQFIEDTFQNIKKDSQKNHFDFIVNRKQKTMTQKFKHSYQPINEKQKQTLIAQIERLKAKNKDLELKFKTLSNSLNENINKQNRPTNKMREKTQKQRIKQLEIQNHNLQQTIQGLKMELKEVRDSRMTEQTQNSQIQNTFQFQNQLQINQKQIFLLNQQIRKLQIQIDFLNRRNHSQINIIKLNYEKQLKVLKDRNQQLSKFNIQVKKKNTQLKYIIKGSRQKKCSCSHEQKKIQKYESLLQLSSD